MEPQDAQSLNADLCQLIADADFRCGFAALIDIDGNQTALTAGDQGLFPTASIIKVAILLELFHQFQDGKLRPQQQITIRAEDIVPWGILPEWGVGRQITLEELARLMIVVSDNSASNMLIDIVKQENINSRLLSLGLAHTVLRRKFMSDAAIYGENTTTPQEFLTLMRTLAGHDALQEPWRSTALDILHHQQFREKLPLMVSEELWTANKTGELDGVRNDAAIFRHGHSQLFMVGLTEGVKANWKADMLLGQLAHRLCQAIPELAPYAL